jgi:uncharacterized protein YdeI (YjbR/CyaY-like superfamily)
MQAATALSSPVVLLYLRVMKDYEILAFKDEDAFRVWLHENHARVPGIWLKIAKKDSGIASINRSQALLVALCYGWIDGQAKTIDETYYMQKFTPRRARSLWSKINVDLVARLIAEGKMQPAGQAAIDEAKANGRWAAAYDAPSNITVPEELLSALAAHPHAQAFYETLNKTNAYAIILRVQTAIKPETRTKRIKDIIAMLERGEKPH